MVTRNLCKGFLNSKLFCYQRLRWLSIVPFDKSNDVIILKRRGSIALISINRPERKNALNFQVVEGIDKTLTFIEQDESFKVAILCGERGNFCFGYDIEEINADPSMIDKIREVGLFDRYSKIPLIASVTGFAQGPGFELALWCDFRIVEESAVMGGFAKQLGLPMTEQTAKKFVSIIGYNKAMDWILTGRTVKGKEAFESGIANRVVAIGTGLGQAFSFASGLVNMPEACLRADRATLNLVSEKYSMKSKESIISEREAMVKAALKDFKDGKFQSNDGDVRKRHND